MTKKYVDKTKNIIIYGASVVGITLYKHLIKQGFKVSFFFDKRADEIKEINGIKVRFDDINLLKDKSEYLVIIAVKNVFDHEEIVELLRENGFYNILYRPIEVINGYKNCKLIEINKLYDMFTEGFVKGEIKIPLIKTKHKKRIKDESFIKKIDNEYKLVYIPMSLIYTDKSKKNSFNDWRNINIFTSINYFNLYDYFECENNSNGNIYIEFCKNSAKKVSNIKTTFKWEENIFRNRHMIYRKLIEKKNIDFDFFKRNAPLVLWNDEKKYFNLVGCKHRTSFLAYQGYDFLICKIANSDFKKWINEDILTKFIDKYEEKEIRNIDILHPFFYEKSDITSSFDKEIYKRILIFLSESLYNRYGKVDFSKMKILDLNFDSGFFSLAISKMVKVVDKVIFNKREASLLEDLKKLLYIDNLKLISKPKQLYQYDIVVTNYIDFLLMMKSFDLKNNKYIIIKFPLKDNGERKKNIDEKMLGYSYFSVISFFSENDFWEIGVYIYD